MSCGPLILTRATDASTTITGKFPTPSVCMFGNSIHLPWGTAAKQAVDGLLQMMTSYKEYKKTVLQPERAGLLR